MYKHVLREPKSNVIFFIVITFLKIACVQEKLYKYILLCEKRDTLENFAHTNVLCTFSDQYTSKLGGFQAVDSSTLQKASSKVVQRFLAFTEIVFFKPRI